MNTFVKRVATVMVSLFLLFYVGYQVFRALYDPIKTETVFSQSLYDTVETEMIAIRSEKVLDDKVEGYLSYKIGNGEKVSSGGTIAEVFAKKNDSLVQNELDNVLREIAIIDDIEKLTDISQSGLSVIENNMWQNLHELSDQADKSLFSNINGVKLNLLSLMNKRQLTIGKSIDFSARKKELNDEKKRLESSFNKAKSNIKSPVAGYYVSGVDGYEDTLTIDSLNKLTASEVDDIARENRKVNISNKADDTNVGKVVGNYEWYLACNVELDRTIDLLVNNEYNILLPFISDEPVPATLISSEKDGKDRALMIFKCTYMSNELSSMRVATAQIRVREYKGLQILSSRVMTNEKGEKGVYALVGDTITFKKIVVEYANHEYVICKVDSKHDKKEYIKLYDELIVEGSGLYDGRTIS